jgi:WXG100 family type VII secretion target
MQRAAQQLDSAYSTVTGLRTTLEGHKAELLGGWAGEAASAFSNVYEAFDADMAKVLTAMNTLHEKLVSTHITYVATEAEQSATVNKVAGLLNK